MTPWPRLPEGRPGVETRDFSVRLGNLLRQFVNVGARKASAGMLNNKLSGHCGIIIYCYEYKLRSSFAAANEFGANLAAVFVASSLPKGAFFLIGSLLNVGRFFRWKAICFRRDEFVYKYSELE